MSGMTAPAEDGWREKLARQKERLQSLRDAARERYAGGAPGLQVAALICQMTDEVICELFEASLLIFPVSVRETIREQVAIVAVGGTGRGELAPFSDVDLLFLHAARCAVSLPECISQFVRDCWDAGIRLGHSVRTPRDALAAAQLDPQFATSLVEARLLWGSERLFETLTSRFRHQVARGSFTKFYRDVVRAREAERQQFGETERQLEPDVKRSPGGLRDIQLIRWIGFGRYGTPDLDMLRLEGALSREDEQALVAAQEFITRIRVDLHFSAGKAQEVLTKEEQLRLADLHGISPKAGQRPVERFMSELFFPACDGSGGRRVAIRRSPPADITGGRLWKFVRSHSSNELYRVSGDRDRFRARSP